MDEPIQVTTHGPVRIIVLFPESTEQLEHDPDDTPVEYVKASLRRALHQAKAGQRLHVSDRVVGD